jgi:CheY-like chemotaxis protein
VSNVPERHYFLNHVFIISGLSFSIMQFQGPIIVVDDDPDDHVILHTVFENLGITSPVKFFSDGTSVLEYLRSSLDEPFIIFCDINMPRISGLDLREIINEDHMLRRKSIPFVFISNGANVKQIRRAYELTVQGIPERKGNTNWRILILHFNSLSYFHTICLPWYPSHFLMPYQIGRHRFHRYSSITNVIKSAQAAVTRHAKDRHFLCSVFDPL